MDILADIERAKRIIEAQKWESDVQVELRYIDGKLRLVIRK